MAKKVKGFKTKIDTATESRMADMGGLTAGDWVGMAGSVIGSISEMVNTLSAAKATKPTVNRYIGFNEKALTVNKEQQNQIDTNEQNAKKTIERKLKLDSNTSKARNRGSASGLSQLRSLDLATDLGTMESQIAGFNQVEGIYGQRKDAAKTVQQNLLTQQDTMEMQGAEKKDIADQMNLDNFYSNFATNLAGATESIQKIGKDMNENQYKQDFLDVLPYTNTYGFGFGKEDGKFSMFAKGNDKTPKYSVTNPEIVASPTKSASVVSNPFGFDFDASFQEILKNYKSPISVQPNK